MFLGGKHAAHLRLESIVADTGIPQQGIPLLAGRLESQLEDLLCAFGAGVTHGWHIVPK